jgi:hypothetical protein
VDTGLGAVPKALSTVSSRAGLVTARTIETAAPPDVDAVWLDRVSEFVPDDVVPVVEPLRPHSDDQASREAWFEAVRRVAEHGCAPKLRCGGSRPSDVPSTADVEQFVRVAVLSGHEFTTLGLGQLVRSTDPVRHGMLNLLVAVARAVDDGDIRAALESTDAGSLAAELAGLSDDAVAAVRKLLSRCGTDPGPLPVEELAGLGLIA